MGTLPPPKAAALVSAVTAGDRTPRAGHDASLVARLMAAQGSRRPTRERVYDAALKLFAAQGYGQTTLKQIANEVGIEVPSLYTHTKSKQELFFELVHFSRIEVLDLMRAVVEASPSSPGARLYATTHAHVSFHCQRRSQIALADQDSTVLSPAQAMRGRVIDREYGQIFVTTLRDGVANRQFRPVSPEVTAFGVIAMGTRTARWFKEVGPLSAEQVADQYAEFALRGVASPLMLAGLDTSDISIEHIHALSRQFAAATSAQTPEEGPDNVSNAN
jgi:AcrR family transcriptional regulator